MLFLLFLFQIHLRAFEGTGLSASEPGQQERNLATPQENT